MISIATMPALAIGSFQTLAPIPGVSRSGGTIVVKPFLHYVRRSGRAPFAWFRIAMGLVMPAAIAAGALQGH